MKREADSRAIIVKYGRKKYRTVFDTCTSIKDMNRLIHGGRAIFSVPIGNIDENQPATIRNLLGQIRRGAKKYSIPFNSIGSLESFRHLASEDGIKFS